MAADFQCPVGKWYSNFIFVFLILRVVKQNSTFCHKNDGIKENELKHNLLLVFSVTPFKIDQNTNQNLSIDKVQNLVNERR